MFALRLGRSLGQPLKHFVAVNHALINRSWFSSELNVRDTERPYFGGINGLGEELSNKLLQDIPPYNNVKPGAYLDAVFESRKDFVDRVVVDVDAGAGLLSLLAVQAGARHVYAVEAYGDADCISKLGSPYAERITVIKGKMEEIELPEKADILISKQMGTLILHPKILNNYVIARDKFLKPDGKMFPSLGRIHMAPITDKCLFNGVTDKAFVKPYDPKVVVASRKSHMINFNTMEEEDAYDINIPLNFTASVGATIHGLAWWFDVHFNGSTLAMWLPTSHVVPTGYWQQFRCMLSKPIHVVPGQEITGRLHLVAHQSLCYIIYLTMSAEQGGDLQTSSAKIDLDKLYMYDSEDYDEDGATDHLVKTQDVPTMQGHNEEVVGALQQPSGM